MTRRLAAILFTDVVGYTALMGADEEQALAAVKRSRAKIRGPVEAHGGAFREYEGDGTLSMFPSAVEAVSCAIEIQNALSDDPDLQVRIGIHVGDVLEEDGAMYGDGVNVAARILQLAEPGGICVSEPVYDEVRNKPGIPVRRLGQKRLKNVNRPVNVFALDELGDADRAPDRSAWWRRRPAIAAALLVALGAALVGANEDTRLSVASWALVQMARNLPVVDAEVQFTHSKDGTRIAWASAGEGSPVVQVQVWGTSAEQPLPFLVVLHPEHRIVWYDGRGFGLSQRGATHSIENQIEDLSAVIEAAGLDTFALFGISGGSPAAIAYTALHPDRVTRLALYGARAMPAQEVVPEGMIDRSTWLSTIDIAERHWGTPNETFRQFFVGLFASDATPLELRVFERYFLAAGSAEEASRYLRVAIDTDVTAHAEHIRTPTLLVHRRDDPVIPYEAALDLAGRIPTARLLTLGGSSHIFLPREREGQRAMQEIAAFLRDDPVGSGARVSDATDPGA